MIGDGGSSSVEGGPKLGLWSRIKRLALTDVAVLLAVLVALGLRVFDDAAGVRRLNSADAEAVNAILQAQQF